MEVDVLVVGQGLAGSLLSWFLTNEKKTHVVVDSGGSVSASKVAGGMINPITGRNFVKTWKADELLPFARATYREMEKVLQQEVLRELPLYRLFKNPQHRQHWLEKWNGAEIGQYVENPDVVLLPEKLHTAHGGLLLRAMHVQLQLLMEAYRQHLQEQGQLVEAGFDYQVEWLPEGGRWKNIRFRQLVCCEGWHATKSPWFGYLPFQPVKGEILTVCMPELQTEMAVSRNVGVIPLKGDLYRVGATYSWKPLDEQPTDQQRQHLEEQLKALVQVPFEVVDHQAAVRPATRDRRPFLGQHPQHPQLWILNGLGTKGASLAPFFAHQLVRHIFDGKPLDQEVNVARFLDWYKKQ